MIDFWLTRAELFFYAVPLAFLVFSKQPPFLQRGKASPLGRKLKLKVLDNENFSQI